MGSTKKIVQSGDFLQGLQTYKPAHMIPDGASPYMRNVDFYHTFLGALAKRKGTQKVAQLGDSGTIPPQSFPYISGLYQFLRSIDGAHFLYASTDNDVFQIDGVHGSSIGASESWTSVFTFGGPGTGTGLQTGATATDPAGLKGTGTEFSTLLDTCVMVNQNIATQQTPGGVPFSTLTGTPPANARFVVAHQGRLFIANTSAGKSRLHWSAVGDPFDWVSVANAGFVDVSSDDGDQITGLKSCGDLLFIFKRYSVWILSGYKPDNFVLTARQAAAGCVSNRTIADNGPFLVYLSDTGIHAINNAGLASLLSTGIRTDIENISVNAKAAAVGGLWNKRQYWLCFDSNGDGLNDSAYILNMENGAWSYYTNIKSSVFLTLDDFSLYSGGSDKAIIRNHNVTNDDEGVAIAMEWRSREYDYEDVFSFKRLQDFMLYAKVVPGKSFTMNVFVDGIDSADTQTIPLTQTLGATQANIMNFVKSIQAEQGRTIQFVIKNTELDAPVEIYAFTALAEIIQRQYSA